MSRWSLEGAARAGGLETHSRACSDRRVQARRPASFQLACEDWLFDKLAALSGAKMISTMTIALSRQQLRAESVRGPAYVRDGDTIVVDDVAVRLQGLLCPERDEPGGSTATQAMTQLTRGQNVSCTLTGERTYDPIVGTCYVGDTDLTAAVIRQGMCARCPRYDPRQALPPRSATGGSLGPGHAGLLRIARPRGRSIRLKSGGLPPSRPIAGAVRTAWPSAAACRRAPIPAAQCAGRGHQSPTRSRR